MQAHQWIELIEKFPPEDHETLLVGTASGVEISLQSILRLEPEYLVIRGRLSGTTEEGRVFILPYDRLIYLHYTREVSDERLARVFGELRSLERQPPTQQDAGETPEPTANAEEPQAAEVDLPKGKATLRERLRARMAQLSGSQQGPRSVR